jgi:glycosyltransferase involved in cell wall biosynthesis
MNKLKIAVIGLKGLPAFGGAATVGENIILKLKNDYDFTVLSISSHTNLKNGYYKGIKQIVFDGINSKGLNTILCYLKCLFHCLFVIKYDIIYLHHGSSGFITPLLKSKYKVLITLHGMLSRNNDPKYGKIANRFFRLSERLNVKYADIVVSVSKEDAFYCELRYGRKVYFIPNGVNVKNTFNDQKSDSICFAANRIYEIKGLHILLEAFKKLKYNKKKLIVIGDLEQVINYKKSILRLSEGLNVEFTGHITDKEYLFKVINQSSLFVFPSRYEAMSMMLLEVISLQIPVIASNIKANTSVFNEDEVLFFNSENADSLAEKILWAENNYCSLLDMSKRAFTRLTKEYSWDNISNQYSLLFDSLKK